MKGEANGTSLCEARLLKVGSTLRWMDTLKIEYSGEGTRVHAWLQRRSKHGRSCAGQVRGNQLNVQGGTNVVPYQG